MSRARPRRRGRGCLGLRPGVARAQAEHRAGAAEPRPRRRDDRRRRERRAGAEAGRHRRRDGHHRARTCRRKHPRWCCWTTTSRPSSPRSKKAAPSTTTSASSSASRWRATLGRSSSVLVGPLLGMPLPFAPFQILWMNLVTDGVLGLGMSVEPAERGAMKRPPHPPVGRRLRPGPGPADHLDGPADRPGRAGRRVSGPGAPGRSPGRR